jgi:hypothetical protein
MIAIVSSIPPLLQQRIAFAMRDLGGAQGPSCRRLVCCNAGATVRTRRVLPSWVAAILLLTAFIATPASAQDDEPAAGDAHEGHRTAAFVEFIGGAVTGFASHEAGHLVFDGIFDADPGVKRVSFGGIPFFAITHRSGLSAAEEFTISSAGFWVQHATSEWILTSRPDLRTRHSPFLKGWLAWNILASGAYSVAAFARIGPPERDTRGMAASLSIPEPWVGGMILAPAALDAWRYFHPGSRWARWTSRIAKAGLVVLVVAAD